MRPRRVIAIVGLLLIGAGVAFRLAAEPIPDQRVPTPVVFVCRNGVAMSVWSAAYFNRLAAARGLRQRAVSRAALPSYQTVPLNMTFALALDGFRLAGYRPAVVSPDDLRAAELVVAIDTDLPAGLQPPTSALAVWNGFPPMRDQYLPSRRALKARVEALIDQLAVAPLRRPAGATARADRSRAA